MRVLALRVGAEGRGAAGADREAPAIVGAACVDWTPSIAVGGSAAVDARVELMDPYVPTNVPAGSLRVRVRLHPAPTDPAASEFTGRPARAPRATRALRDNDIAGAA